MSLPVAERRRQDLLRKLRSFDEELAQWELESKKGKRFEKHHSQVRRLSAQLRPLAERVSASLRAMTAAKVLEERATIEAQVLSLYRVWEFFRAKLALRCVEWLTDYLATADELVWECYEPALDSANIAATKEPPLVYLNGGWSPFAISRGVAYEAEPVEDEEIEPQLRKLLKKLPVPVVGTPWYSVKSLGEILVLAHETGHLVEDDFALAPPLDDGLEKALRKSDERTKAWLSWRCEMFADFWGVLCAGPGFARSLLDFLGGPTADILAEAVDPRGKYPTNALRAMLVVELVRLRHSPAAADEIAEEWAAIFSKQPHEKYAGDVPLVAKALMSTTFPTLGNKTAVEIVSKLAPARIQRVVDDATAGVSKMKEKRALALLVGGYEALRRMPNRGDEIEATIMAAVRTNRAEGTRGTKDVELLLSEPRVDALAASDARAGRDLFDLLLPRAATSANGTGAE